MITVYVLLHLSDKISLLPAHQTRTEAFCRSEPSERSLDNVLVVAWLLLEARLECLVFVVDRKDGQAILLYFGRFLFLVLLLFVAQC